MFAESLAKPVGLYGRSSSFGVSTLYDALRWRAVGTCFSQQDTEQNRSLSRPVLHDATVHRMAEVPGGMSLRQVAQTKLAMTVRSTSAYLYVYFRISSTSTAMSWPPR